MEQSIFRSYDIRGIYPSQLNEETALKVGRSFVEHAGAKKIAVGYDGRLSGPALLKSLSEGIILQGADVYDIGQTPTEGIYFTLGNYDFDGAIMVTASHNPKEYNGFKMLVKKDGVIQMVRGVDLVLQMEKENFPEKNQGNIFKKDIWQDYYEFIIKFSGEIKPLKLVVDGSNGVIGKAISGIKEKLPVQIIELNFTPDGNFPNHSPNPLLEGSTSQISVEIKNQNVDFGFIFDSDADRIFLIDENGQMVPADITLLFLANHFLQKNPGSAIAYNAICSKYTPEFIEKMGGKPIKTAVGFVNVREGLMKNNGVMGGELSGHYCFKDFFFMDSGVIAFLTLLQVISKDGRKVSEIAKELSVYFKSAEMNFQIEDKQAIIEKIKEKYADGKQDYLDGVTVEYKDWWFNVRPSNTEPLLRLTIEADTKEMLELKKIELRDFISKN
ncbi:MAG: phosphomannomutase/phosphoglucomutase [Patescibacteria group bacterium]